MTEEKNERMSLSSLAMDDSIAMNMDERDLCSVPQFARSRSSDLRSVFRLCYVVSTDLFANTLRFEDDDATVLVCD